MTKMDKRTEDREALERLLDIYGADRTRWPARERLRFAGIVSEDKVAARMLAQAGALDRLLEQAPRASGADVEALKERIMAAALRSRRAATRRRRRGQAGVGQGRVPRRPTGTVRSRGLRAASGRRRRCWRPRWCSASCSARPARLIRRWRRWRRLPASTAPHPIARNSRWVTTLTARWTRICYERRNSALAVLATHAALGAWWHRWRSTC